MTTHEMYIAFWIIKGCLVAGVLIWWLCSFVQEKIDDVGPMSAERYDKQKE